MEFQLDTPIIVGFTKQGINELKSSHGAARAGIFLANHLITSGERSGFYLTNFKEFNAVLSPLCSRRNVAMFTHLEMINS